MINKNILPVFCVFFSIVVLEILNSTKPKHPYAGLTIEQLVPEYGYPIEAHEVVTDDGYILTLHRIPHGREASSKNRTPVLLMHGFTQSAIDFVNGGPKNALSFLLADKGFDVWMGNARGNTWSRRHKFLNPNKDQEFWDYSLHEIGYYDTPAFIDYILEKTKQSSLHYVGYSQGTTVFFILSSEKPEYIRKVKHMTALAPAIYLKDPMGPVLSVVKHTRKVLEELLSKNSLISSYLKHICNENSLFVDLCLHHTFLLHGYHRDGVNKTELSLIFSNTPAGVSPKQLLHIAQLMESGEFHRYDLGMEENFKKYGQAVPPRYNVSRIYTPIALYHSNNDWTINMKNIERILRTLPNVVRNYNVPLEDFNHNDFIYAKNVGDLLYKQVIEEMSKY